MHKATAITRGWRIACTLCFAPIVLPITAWAQSTVFWVDEDSRTILRGALDGSGSPTPLYSVTDGLLFPQGIAVDSHSGALYWADAGGSKICAGDVFGVSLPVVLFNLSDGVDAPLAIDIDVARGKLYWSEFGIIAGGDQKIKSGKVDGSGSPVTLYADEPIQVGFPIGRVVDIALDVIHNDIYWADASLNRIVVAKIDGSGRPTMLYGPTDLVNGPWGIELDIGSGYVYWSEASKLRVANMDGSGTPFGLFSGISGSTRGFALDFSKDKIYWTSDEHLWAGNMDGSETPVVLFDVSDGVIRPSYITIDSPQPMAAVSFPALAITGALMAVIAVAYLAVKRRAFYSTT